MYVNEDISQVIKAIQRGELVVVLDDQDNENEGDVVIAAEFITKESINFMAKYCRGLICLAMDNSIAKRLELKMHTRHNVPKDYVAFMESIDALDVTTGISPEERAFTIRKAININSTRDSFKIPGHIFPIVANPQGLLNRRGHTEASVDLMKIANLIPAAAICEIINDNGDMAREKDLTAFCKHHNILMTNVETIYREVIRLSIYK